MIHRSEIGLGVIGLFLATACSSSVPTRDRDAGADGSTGVERRTSEPRCNSIVQQGTELPVTGSPFPPPLARGGRILDGIYVLTEARLHGAQYAEGPIAGAFEAPTTLEVRGASFETLVSSPVEARASWYVSFSPNSHDVTLSLVCAYPMLHVGSVAQAGAYTVTETGFVLTLDVGARGVYAQEYSRRLL